MTTQQPETDLELQRVLWACNEYWATEPLPIEDRVVCYKWVLGVYKARFGAEFPKSRLETLARLGSLEKADTSRGGKRRYYRISNPSDVRGQLAKQNFN